MSRTTKASEESSSSSNNNNNKKKSTSSSSSSDNNQTQQQQRRNNNQNNQNNNNSISIALFAILLGFIWSYGPGFCNENWSNNEPSSLTTKTKTRTTMIDISTTPPFTKIVRKVKGGVGGVGEDDEEEEEDDKDLPHLTPSKWITFDNGVGSEDGKSTTTKLVGKLYMPTTTNTNGNNDKDDPVPVIIMANGLGLAQDCSLHNYIASFISEGNMAVFTFDYTTFGYSSGLPRHVVNPNTHLTDLISAITTIHNNSYDLNIDRNNIGLWGTSFGGGHVFIIYTMLLLKQQKQEQQEQQQDTSLSSSKTKKTKKKLPKIKAIISQVPHLGSGLESIIGTVMNDPITYIPALIKTLGGIIKGSIYAALLGNKAWYLPLHGQPGSTAAMQNIGDDEGYKQLCSSTSNTYYYTTTTTSSSSSSMENQEQQQEQEQDNDIDNDDNNENKNSNNNNNNMILYWRNAMTSLSAIRIMFYRPLNYFITKTTKTKSNTKTANNNNNNNNNVIQTTQTQTKLLFVGAENDTLCPTKYIKRVVDNINNNNNNDDSKIIEYVLLPNANHFDVYHSEEIFNQTIQVEINFFKKHFFFGDGID